MHKKGNRISATRAELLVPGPGRRGRRAIERLSAAALANSNRAAWRDGAIVAEYARAAELQPPEAAIFDAALQPAGRDTDQTLKD